MVLRERKLHASLTVKKNESLHRFAVFNLGPAAGQLVEELLVQRLVRLLRAHRQEDVAADELVHHFTIRREAAEHDVLLLELDHHVLHLPVDVPRL